MKRIVLISLIAITNTLARAQDQTIISFGSCSRQDAPEQLWKEVIAQKPDLWIWLGDNIYGDSKDMAVLKRKYDQQKAHPDYQLLLRTCPVIGTWDDHDYGINDGGKGFAPKAQSQQLLLDFLDVSAGSVRRSRAGAYSSFLLGSGDRQVKVILLDTRYFRDTLYRAPAPERGYQPNPTGQVLGEEQWTWLEKELKNSPANLHIIGSSIQFLSAEHPYEKWGNFPAERQRMINLILKLKPNRVLFISGDRHIGEVSKMPVPGLPYPIYDFTSSGLTHTWQAARDEKNQYRVGQLIVEKNYGVIRINWNNVLPTLQLELCGKENQLWQGIPVRFD
jgi:alkaline phosphatase D